MKKPHCFLATLLIGVSLLGFSGISSAADIPDQLRQQVLQDIKLIEQEGPKISDMMAAIREAGASYLPEIVAPIDVDKYQDMEQRRLIVGVYLMDLTYAGTFQQAQPAAQFGEAIYRLLEQLGYPQPDMERRYREALEQIDQPDGENRLKELLRQQDEDTAWQEMLKTGEGTDIVVDGLYGFLLEGLYLTGEISALSNYDPRIMRYVNEMRNSFLAFKRVLLLFEDDPELAEMVEKDERIRFITDLLKVIGDLPEIGPEQVKALRPMITKARNDIVR